jgi:hypothetical protein
MGNSFRRTSLRPVAEIFIDFGHRPAFGDDKIEVKFGIGFYNK